ncbi:hypothetical protein [Streptomyces olivochromogenes]|uniref:hypothetical protein n=1 Tax=Streptomyces olivochromogenes TaxID=1963 RepID=UPI003686BCB5
MSTCQFTESPDFYLSLRYRGGAFRMIVYDRHPRHTHPRLTAACDARRLRRPPHATPAVARPSTARGRARSTPDDDSTERAG